MEIKDLVSRISYFRSRENLSARELSLRIDKHAGYINKLESDNFNLPCSVLLQILDAMNVPIEEFFANNFRSYKEDKALNDLFKDLSKENKDTIINLIKQLK